MNKWRTNEVIWQMLYRHNTSFLAEHIYRHTESLDALNRHPLFSNQDDILSVMCKSWILL